MKITKKCSGCGQIKSVDEFGSDTSRIDGKNGKCKACIIERNKARNSLESAIVPAQSTVSASNDLDVVTVDQWALALFVNESERRVRDIELAQRLDMPRQRDIRPLIKRHWADLLKFGEITMRETVSRIEIGPKNARRFRDDIVKEYWLNKDQALYIALKSDTVKANEISVALVLTFRELERRVIAEASKLTRQEIIYNRMLLENNRDWELLWKEDVPRELSRIYGWDMTGFHGFPVWMGRITARIYDLVVGKDTMDEARRRRGTLATRTMLHDWFQDGTREHFRKRLDIVLALIRTSTSVADFWDRMVLEFGQSMSQMQLGFADDGCCTRCGVPIDPKSRFCNQCGTRVAGKLSA